ncbi:hypothetical protein D3C79_933390 [compost metagenome]
MQLMAAGEGFESLSDKWAAQERIQTTCDAIARETAYVIAPEPEALGVAGVRKQLSDLDARCRELIKGQPDS